MKKLTGSVLVCAVAALFAAGCNKEKAPESHAAMVPTATTAPAAEPAAKTATTKAAESTGVAECDSYLAAVEKYLNCAKVPQAVRDGQAMSAKQMRSSWASWATMPEDARKAAQAAAKTSCASALTAVKQAASASGCSVE